MLKPYFQGEGVSIYHAASEDLVRSLPWGHFAALVLDPPSSSPEDYLSRFWGGWMRPEAKALILGEKRYRIVPSRAGWIPCEEMGTESAFGHPVSRSVEILADLIRLLPAGPVLDPYMGSGSVMVAAHRLGREVVGIEIERKWCQASAERLGALVPA